MRFASLKHGLAWLPVWAGLCAGGFLQANPAPSIDVSKFPAAMVEDVVVPLPGEIFAVLDKLGDPNWRAEIRSESQPQVRDRSQAALLLGTVVANGFIAVQARDAEEVRSVGREVLRLSEALGVRDSVMPHCAAIMDQADARNWREVKIELDKAQQNVRQAMQELRDEQLAQLVSLGGWLRGTEALTSIVGKDYSKDGAELLHQPDLLQYFIERLEAMPPRMRDHGLVTEVAGVLQNISPLITEYDGRNIPPESVEKIHSMTRAVVLAIGNQGA